MRAGDVQARAAPDEGRREAPGQADQQVGEDEGGEWRRGGSGRRGRDGGRLGHLWKGEEEGGRGAAAAEDGWARREVRSPGGLVRAWLLGVR